MIVDLAGIKVALDFSQAALRAIPFCDIYFRDFIVDQGRPQARLQVSIADTPPAAFLGPLISSDEIMEARLPHAAVAERLSTAGYPGDSIQINDSTLCTFGLGGLLLFDPAGAGGHLLLPPPVDGGFRCLYRLLWLYFAQVLAEFGACFLHAAALVRNDRGYLFPGDSGAGKSTLSAMVEKETVLSDDSPIFRKTDSAYRVFASPYHQLGPSAARIPNQPARSAEVNGCYFLIQDERAGLTKIAGEAAVLRIVNRHLHFFAYLSPRARIRLVDLFIAACHNISCHEFHFSRETPVWEVIGR